MIQNQQPAIRILICEDQQLLRDSLRTVLDLEPGLRVIGVAADGMEGIKQAMALCPDVILMDIKMPRLSGVDATAAITTSMPDARIIMLTTFASDDYVYAALRAGAMEYVLKDVPAAELVATIKRVAANEVTIQPAMASQMLHDYQRRGSLAVIPPEFEAPGDDLSQREMDVLQLLARGASNRDIATTLTLAEGTVKNHVSNILLKLHAANRTHAAQLARERGLVN